LVVDSNPEDSIFKLCLPQTIAKSDDKVDLPLLFSSPEVVSGGYCSIKNDIWGVGILLYILIYGQFPFAVDKPLNIANEIKNGVEEIDLSEREDQNKFFSIKNKNKNSTSLLCRQFLSSMLSQDQEKRFFLIFFFQKFLYYFF
jgi:serine/threonine protein kinase